MRLPRALTTGSVLSFVIYTCQFSVEGSNNIAFLHTVPAPSAESGGALILVLGAFIYTLLLLLLL